MSSESDNQKEFLENIDRILAGEKIETDKITDKDLSSTLEFVRKMTALHVAPSPEFKSQLKARLLKKLVAKEEAARTKSKSGLFSWFIQHQSAWQAITAILVVAIICGLLWGTGLL